MSPDSQCWLEHSERAGEVYLRTLLSNHRLPASIRAEFADGVRQINAKAKLALAANELATTSGA